MPTLKVAPRFALAVGLLACAPGQEGGAPAGDADPGCVADGCGVCDADPTNDCARDCAGTFGGPALVDSCGTCDADPSNDCSPDCAGVFGGTATLDECGVCAGGTTGVLACSPDCAGVFGGPARLDNCGTCDADPANDCAADCLGVPGGSAVRDGCGVCDADPSNDCAQDCANVWGGIAAIDECGDCTGGTTGQVPCTQDCAGVWGGPARLDNCGACDTDPTNDCTDDCAGVPGGPARLDPCGTCDSDVSNDCVRDCANVWGGNAYLDDCGACVGGTTGREPCVIRASECAGVSAPLWVRAGATFEATVSMRNTGNVTWTSDATPYRLGPQNPGMAGRWGRARVELPGPTAPGETADFAFTATAPAELGSLPFDWMMLEEGVTWFGALCSARLRVEGCGDGVRNGGETGVDCGGPCGSCADGESCGVPGDCQSGSCYRGVCASARVEPTPANIDYFLGRTCYGIHAFDGDWPGDTAEGLAAQYDGCKLIRWVDYNWRDDRSFAGFDDAFFAKIGAFASAMHARDPEVVLEAAIGEYTCEPLLDRTAYDFDLFPEIATLPTPSHRYSGAGTFDGALMIRSGTRGHWGVDCDGLGGTDDNGVTDLSAAETKKFHTWLAARYFRAGIEAIYLPQSDLVSGENASELADTVARLRALATHYARRGKVLVGGEVFRHAGYHVVNGTVDYLKAIAEVDLVRGAGAGATAATPTSVPAYAPACVEDERMLWESRLQRRLSPCPDAQACEPDVCIVDNPMGYRDSYRYIDGDADPAVTTWVDNPGYAQPWPDQGAPLLNAFWRPEYNAARIPVILELDGSGPSTWYGTDPSWIRGGLNPQVFFLSTRGAGARRAFLEYVPWAARHLNARERMPVYAALPIKEDQAGHVFAQWAYPDEWRAYCPGGNFAVTLDPPNHPLSYLVREEYCDDLAVARGAVTFTPADAGLALHLDDGQVVAVGGGYRANLEHRAGQYGAARVLDVEVATDQASYAVLTDAGNLHSYPGGAVVAGLTGAVDVETAPGGERLVLFAAGGTCAIASSASGYAVGSATLVPGCTAPRRLAASGPRLAVLERDGRLWLGGSGGFTASTVLQASGGLAPGDAWTDLEWPLGDGMFVTSSFGRVVRRRANDTLELLRPASWSAPTVVDAELMRSGGQRYLYLLDFAGGLHPTPLTSEHQSVASFPDLYPAPYYGGGYTGRYVGLSGVSARPPEPRRSPVLLANQESRQVSRLRLVPSGLAVAGVEPLYLASSGAWRVAGDADFDGDGVGDLLWRHTATGQVWLVTFTRDGAVKLEGSVRTEPDLAWKLVHTPDLDGDGRADLLWWNAQTGQVWAMLLDGATVTAEGLVYSEPNLAWNIVAAADLEGAGKQNQLVWRNRETGQVYLQTVSASAGSFSASGVMLLTETDLAWRLVAAPDLDGDDRSDLLWRHATTGQVRGMLMRGASIVTQGVFYSEPDPAWAIVAHGDHDGDGRGDLTWHNGSTGAVHVMLMHGLTIAAQATIYSEPELRWRVLGPAYYAP